MAIYPTAYDALGVPPGTTKMCRLVSAWGASEAHAFCQALRPRMIHRLSGYDEAPWEIHSRGQYVRSDTLGRGDDVC